MESRRLVAILGTLTVTAVVALAACGKPSTSSSPPTTTTTSTTAAGVSLSRNVQPIFDANCVICHTGTNGPAGLSLDKGSSYTNLVNVNSTEAPALKRVAPASPDKSYLIAKLSGTQGQVGGTGAQMPFGASPLPQAQINVIQQWIAQGAPNN